PTVPASALPHEQDFIVTKGILKSISHFSQADPQRIATITHEINNYMLQLKRMRLQDAMLGKGSKQIMQQSITGLLFLLLGFPLYLYVLLHNYIPYIIPSRVARAITTEEEWFAPIMLTTGIFTFPIFYSLQLWLMLQWLDLNAVELALYFLSLPL